MDTHGGLLYSIAFVSLPNFDFNIGLYMYSVSFGGRNDVTPSDVMKMKTDVNKQIKMTSR